MTPDRFISEAMANPANAELLRRLPSLGLDQCFLTAGSLFQAVWNGISGNPAEMGVKDYDVFYFDGGDLSFEAEDAVISRVQSLVGDRQVKVDVKNQARVHCWYETRFGVPRAPLASTKDGIDRYLVVCTCIGIDVANGELYAPNGLPDLYNGLLRMNPLNAERELFRQKAQDYRARWPWLTIID
jgi:hypothetical protein